MNEILLLIWLGAVGAALGSFLNVVIYRLPRGKSIVSPPSHCPKCRHKIRSYDNLPIFGWFLLGGKCRDCKLPISFRYPIIETVACAIVTTFAILLMPADFAIESVLDKDSVQVLAKIAWFSVLHLYLLTFGMIDFDRQTLKPRLLILFLAPFLICSVIFTPTDTLLGMIVSFAIGFLLKKIMRVNDRTLWLFASLAVGGFLGWPMAIVILLVTLPCHAAIMFVTRRSYAVLSLAIMSYVVTVWVFCYPEVGGYLASLFQW
ncbi:MAG: prepilin peptidase [Planctomycetaceae bacterium]|nr:prepilin peptidase [Planctomycetaceae bacterium]